MGVDEERQSNGYYTPRRRWMRPLEPNYEGGDEGELPRSCCKRALIFFFPCANTRYTGPLRSLFGVTCTVPYLVLLVWLVLGSMLLHSLVVHRHAAAEFANLKFDDSDGHTLFAYVSTPADFDTSTQQYPLVLALPDRDGLSADLQWLCGQLSAHGFLCAALDLNRGVIASNGWVRAYLNWFQTQQEIDHDLDSLLRRILVDDKTLSSRVDKRRVVAGPGWGDLGSRQALLWAARTPHFAAAVDMSGNVLADPVHLGSFNQSVFIVASEHDDKVPPDDIRGFADAIRAVQGATVDLQVLANEKRGFLNRDSIEAGGPGGDVWSHFVHKFLIPLVQDRDPSRGAPLAV